MFSYLQAILKSNWKNNIYDIRNSNNKKNLIIQLQPRSSGGFS